MPKQIRKPDDICALKIVGKCPKDVRANFMVGFPAIYSDLDRNIETECSNILLMRRYLQRYKCRVKVNLVDKNKYIYQNPNN